MNKVFLAGAALAAFGAFPVSAQRHGGLLGGGRRDGAITRVQMQERIEARFRAMDANHDGVLTADELGANGARMMRRIDRDHDGRVTLAELTEAMLARFDRADTNHDGILTREERAAFRGARRDRMEETADPAAAAPAGH